MNFLLKQCFGNSSTHIEKLKPGEVEAGLLNPTTIAAWIKQISAIKIEGKWANNDNEKIVRIGEIADKLLKGLGVQAKEIKDMDEISDLLQLQIQATDTLEAMQKVWESPNSYSSLKFSKSSVKVCAVGRSNYEITLKRMKTATEKSAEKLIALGNKILELKNKLDANSSDNLNYSGDPVEGTPLIADQTVTRESRNRRLRH